MLARNRRRWGDNDHYFGPFTFAFRERWRHTAVILSSGGEDYPGASLRISAFGNTVIMGVPQWLIQPHREKVEARSWDAATIARLGRDWYWSVDEREFGFTLSDGHLSVKLGRQTHDSSTTKDWGCFLPWTQWRHVRRSLYGLAGEHFWTEPQHKATVEIADWRVAFDATRAAEDACPSLTFDFADFDGERLSATTRIEEREWRFGEGKFKWLSLFRRPKISRSLDIRFSGETGQRKGSWKGGTVGHSITMMPGELHEEAFRRYCAENKMTFVGAAA